MRGKRSLHLLVLLALLIVTGCGEPRVRVVPGDEVQTLLIQQAQGHFAEGRYDASARTLRRLLDSYPRSSREAEARWWLARSYEQAGLFKQALAEYRILATLPPHPQARPASYGTDAKTRIAALEQRLGLLAQVPKGLVGLHVSPRTMPDARPAAPVPRAAC